MTVAERACGKRASASRSSMRTVLAASARVSAAAIASSRNAAGVTAPVNAITAADEVIIPVAPGVFAMQGIEDLFELIQLIRDRLDRPNLKVTGFLLNFYERTNVSRDVAADLQKYFGSAVFETQIPKTVSLEEAHSRDGTVFQYAPHSSGAQAFAQLTQEILNHG